MKKWKQRLIMLLCAALVAPSLLFTMPMFTTTAAAGSKSAGWQSYLSDRKAANPTTTAKALVEEGQDFILGDWIYVYDYGKQKSYTAHDIKGVRYSSSNKKVATISRKGVVKAKKKGKTVIKIKVGGTTLTCNLQVVKKKSLTKKLKNADKVNILLKKFRKYRDVKITDKNFDTLYQLCQEMDRYNNSDYYYYSSKSSKSKMKHAYGLIYYPKAFWMNRTKNEVVMPQYRSYMCVRDKMAAYMNKAQNANLTGTLKCDTNQNNATLTFAKKLSAAQFLKVMDATYSYKQQYYGSSFIGKEHLTTSTITCSEIFQGEDGDRIITANVIVSKDGITLVNAQAFAPGKYVSRDKKLLKNVVIEIEKKTTEDEATQANE